jgi:GLPGLI family protein
MNKIKQTIFLLPLILLLFAGTAKAQFTQGKIRYLVVHNWVKKMASVDYLDQAQKDRVSYMWGDDSEYRMYGNLYIKGKKTKYEDSEEKAEVEEEGYSWRKSEYFIYRDFENGKSQDIIKLLGKLYLVEDTIHPQSWKILNDIKEVAGHICMNATWTDTLKKQKVVAWFALDIPIPSGPERYCGLPGLILEVNVNDGALVMTADKFEDQDPGEVVNFPQKTKGKVINEKTYFEILYKYIQSRKAEEQPYFWGIRY